MTTPVTQNRSTPPDTIELARRARGAAAADLQAIARRAFAPRDRLTDLEVRCERLEAALYAHIAALTAQDEAA